ncbi:MAG: STAS domain-containing protein [Anaerolineae bacterium]|nr:STAS domain-containing protein [Anaerolineae bacterium]
MLLKIWGARGSIPAPLKPDDIHQKIMTALQWAGEHNIDLAVALDKQRLIDKLSLSGGTAGGNTTCITIECGDDLLIFDAGSGIRELGSYLMNGRNEHVRKLGFYRGKGHAHLFFTHTHWDHIQGLPFFAPLHVPGNSFDIYHIHDHVPDTLAKQMDATVFPLRFDQIQAELTFHQLKEGQLLKIGEAMISNAELKHPGKAYAYRVEADNAIAVVATDAEYKSLDNTDTLKYRNFYGNADLLIFDAMFSVRESFVKQDWGHSSALIGADIAGEANVKRLVLFHHDPATTDTELMQIKQGTEEYIQSQGLNIEVIVGQEGFEIELKNPTAMTDFHITEWAKNGIVFLTLSGKFGGQATERFRKHLARSLQTHQVNKVILNMDGVSDMQMAGIQALVDARSAVMSLALVKLPENVYRVIELSATTDFFAIYEDEKSALTAFNSH